MSSLTTAIIGGCLVDYVEPPAVGNEAAFVFIHGMFSGKWVFRNWLQESYQHGITACALDLHTEAGTLFNDHVLQVIKLINKIGPVILVGHSLGGLLAQKAASLEPNLVKRVVLVASAPPKGIRADRLFWLRWRYLKAICSGQLFRLEEQDALRYVLNKEMNKEEHVQNSRPASGRILRELASGVRIGKISMPVHVVSGGQDNLLSKVIQRKIAVRYGAHFWTIPEYGHMIPTEDDGRAIREIIAWSRWNLKPFVAL